MIFVILIKYDKKNICAYNIFNLFSWSMIKKNICACNILIYFHEVIILYQNNQIQSVYTITLQIAKNTIVLDFG
jgi:hypothetical protein